MSGNRPLFEETLTGLEAGLRVELIAASPLETCDVSNDAEVVLKDNWFSDFTCIPVREGENGSIVGVLERSGTPPQKTVKQCMRPLDGSMLISAGATLRELIPLLGESPYRLVVTKKGIEGIVTPSDLQKLPVRLYVFALITHLEMLMREIIARRYPNDDDWLALLTDDSRKDINKDWRRLKKRDLNISKLECASLNVECTILEQVLPPEEGKKLKEESKMIRELRNSIDHARGYADDDQRGQTFIDCHEKLLSWIEALPHYLEEPPSASEPVRMLQPAPITTKE